MSDSRSNYQERVNRYGFVFEDGEEIFIDGQYVKTFGIFGVTWNVIQELEAPAQEVYLAANEFYFLVTYDADAPIDGTETTVIQRLAVGDIAQIVLEYESGKRDDYYVNWDEDDTEYDKWQTLIKHEDFFAIRRLVGKEAS